MSFQSRESMVRRSVRPGRRAEYGHSVGSGGWPAHDKKVAATSIAAATELIETPFSKIGIDTEEAIDD
jgi:hypothetical protein